MSSNYQKVGVCVSGGVDSMVLLHKVVTSNDYQQVYCLHVNHQLREVSDLEMSMVRQFCELNNVIFLSKVIEKGTFDKNKSIQNAAREIRYQFFTDMARQYQLDVVYTAHHIQDDIETVLFRILTNRVYTPELGIQAVSYRNSVKYERPLLGTNKSEIYDYAAKFSVPFSEDESNQSNKYKRNYIRNEMMPVIEATFNAQHILDLRDYHKELHQLLEQYVGKYSEGIKLGEIPLTEFMNEQEIVKHHILKQMFNNKADLYNFSKDYLEEICRQIDTNKNLSIPLDENWHIEVAYDKLILHSNKKAMTFLDIQLPGKYNFNGYIIEYTGNEVIFIRTVIAGDYITINHQHQKVSRILKDHKIPRYLRQQLPVFIYGNNIIRVADIKANQHHINQNLKVYKENEHA